MRRAPILGLVFAFALGTAALPSPAGAAPRQGDGSADGELGSPVASRATVALGARRVAIANSDLDGIVSRSEARKYETRFTLMDRNRDGRVSEEKAESSRTGMSRSLRALETAFDARPLTSRRSTSTATARSPKSSCAPMSRRTWASGDLSDEGRGSFFNAADSNADGALSKQELIEAGISNYAGSDANGDGRVADVWEFYGGTRF